MVYDMVLFKTNDIEIRKHRPRRKFKNDEEVFNYFNDWYNEYINTFYEEYGIKALKHYAYLVDNYPNSKYILKAYRSIKRVYQWYKCYVEYYKRIDEFYMKQKR